MSLLDNNFDINITEQSLYNLEVKKMFRNDDEFGDQPISKIHYHGKVRAENRWRYTMHYNRESKEIKFRNLGYTMSASYPWVCITIQEVGVRGNITVTPITLETIYINLSKAVE